MPRDTFPATNVREDHQPCWLHCHGLRSRIKDVLITTSALALFGFGLLLADVKTDYSHSTDFKAYKTYSWLKVDASNTLWSDRIRQAVDKQLSSKGWTMETGSADVAVAAIAGPETNSPAQPSTTDWAAAGPGAASTTPPQQQPCRKRRWGP